MSLIWYFVFYIRYDYYKKIENKIKKPLKCWNRLIQKNYKNYEVLRIKNGMKMVNYWKFLNKHSLGKFIRSCIRFNYYIIIKGCRYYAEQMDLVPFFISV